MPIDTQLSLQDGGFRDFAAEQVMQKLGEDFDKHAPTLSSSFERLVRDDQMGDGGRYRYRRFSRFTAVRGERALKLSATDGHSILQSTDDNPLNGGVLRTFQPLEQDVLQSPLLLALIKHDVEVIESIEPDFFAEPIVVGVHQVRISAVGGTPGKPTPEGIHRDAERYTFQHFWERCGVGGGEFVAYDKEKSQVFRWLQTEQLDSVLFTGSTWHSATPIHCLDGRQSGYRDIFLIDFS